MGERVKTLIDEIKTILLNPFKPYGLEKKLEELLNLMKEMEPKELALCKNDIEDIKRLMERNIDIVADSANNMAKLIRKKGFSRRV